MNGASGFILELIKRFSIIVLVHEPSTPFIVFEDAIMSHTTDISTINYLLDLTSCLVVIHSKNKVWANVAITQSYPGQNPLPFLIRDNETRIGI